MSKYLYVVSYLESKENFSIPIGIFNTYKNAVNYIVIESENKFTKSLHNGFCNVCNEKIKDKDIKYICTDCCNIYLCIDCYNEENKEHCCKVNHELVKFKERIGFYGINDNNGFYHINKVEFFTK